MRKGGDARAERVWDELHKRESRREIKKEKGGRGREGGTERVMTCAGMLLVSVYCVLTSLLVIDPLSAWPVASCPSSRPRSSPPSSLAHHAAFHSAGALRQSPAPSEPFTRVRSDGDDGVTVLS